MLTLGLDPEEHDRKLRMFLKQAEQNRAAHLPRLPPASLQSLINNVGCLCSSCDAASLYYFCAACHHAAAAHGIRPAAQAQAVTMCVTAAINIFIDFTDHGGLA